MVSSLVRTKGLEPPLLAKLDPKSSASANSATSAWYKVMSNKMVTHDGLEPSTPWLKVRCSTDWASGSCSTLAANRPSALLLLRSAAQRTCSTPPLQCSSRLASGQLSPIVNLSCLAGAAGLEPTHDGVKVRCLTDLATPLYEVGVTEGIRTLE